MFTCSHPRRLSRRACREKQQRRRRDLRRTTWIGSSCIRDTRGDLPMNKSAGAIGDVTNFLRQLLLRQLIEAQVPNADVTLLPPGNALPNTPGINLYLYRVVESPSTKNQAWRGNRVTPPSPRPVLGLQLFYLATPTAPPPQPSAPDLAHLCLGVAMLALQENPILNDVHLPEIPVQQVPAVDANTLPDYILESYEQIKVTLVPTSIDEISRIWATLNQPYRLSGAYEGSLVEILPTLPAPPRGAIVLSTNVDVETIGPPLLQELQPSTGPLAKFDNGIKSTKLRINGSHLLFDLKNRDVPLPQHRQFPTVRVGGQIVDLDVDDPQLSERSLWVTMPDDLDAGPQVDERVTLQGKVSTPLTFSVTPWLASTTPIRTALDPRQGNADNKLVLNGIGFSATPLRVLFTGPAEAPAPIDPGSTDTNLTVTIPDSLANRSEEHTSE